jgi:hypothetical protein
MIPRDGRPAPAAGTRWLSDTLINRGTAFTDEERRGLERRAAPTNLQHSEEASGDNTRLGRTCRAEARFDNRKEEK